MLLIAVGKKRRSLYVDGKKKRRFVLKDEDESCGAGVGNNNNLSLSDFARVRVAAAKPSLRVNLFLE